MSQQAFGFRAGFPTASSFPVVFLSLSNSPITIECNGFVKTLSGIDWVEVGTDHPTLPRLGYVATATVVGQEAFKRHNYTVEQNSVIYNGSAMTAPKGRGEDFSIFFNSCDTNRFNTTENPGAYTFMKEFIEAGNKVLGLFHVDDHYGYLDGALLSDTGAGGTGHQVTGWPTNKSSVTQLEYDYAMGYFAAFGLFVNDTGMNMDKWGQDKVRIWAMRNLNVFPQWGDHDSGDNEMGWYILPSSVIGFANSQTLWNLIMKPLQPPSISNRATANHWAGTLGALTIVAPDGITLGSGDATVNFTTPDYGPTTVLSNNQIYDCLDGGNTDAPFKIWGMMYGIKFLDAGSNFASGAQNPLKNARSSEYELMVTSEDDTVNPLSIMANPKTNGMFGTLVTMHGDYHTNKVQYNGAVAYAGNHAESFYSFSVGTLNGSINFGKSIDFVSGYEYDGTILEVYDTAGFVNQNSGHDWWNFRVDIIDSGEIPEMVITDTDKNGVDLWQKKFVQGRGGNYAFDVGVDISAKNTSLSVEES